MLLAAGNVRALGSAEPRIRIGEESSSPGPGRRVLSLDGEPAFELSFWCGTCPFLFQRLDGASGTVSIDRLQERLTEGLDDLDDEVLDAFGRLLPAGSYLPLLLGVELRPVSPVRAGDYFAEEQVATWGLNAFWGLPENPRTPYHRTFQTPVDEGAHLFEFVVPMVPPTWNDVGRVAEFADVLAASSRPTAVAVATLDVCQPAGFSEHPYAHWGLTHFLLDGHHKVQAAAETGRPLRLLSLLSVEGSLATPEQVARVPALRARAAAGRGGGTMSAPGLWWMQKTALPGHSSSHRMVRSPFPGTLSRVLWNACAPRWERPAEPRPATRPGRSGR